MDATVESESAAPRPARESGRSKSPAFELKGIVAPLTALRLRTADLGVITKQLVAKVTQMPQFFQDAPVLVDLGGLGEEGGRLHFSDLASLLRSFKMVPVAVTNADAGARTRAAAAGFGYVAPASPRAGGRAIEIAEPAASAPAAEAAPAQAAAPPAPKARPRQPEHRPPLVVRQPVRSGQTIYAHGTDLVILAPVNSGAEVIADGHVHIYSTLRGRAVAGNLGLPDARIFCQKMDAELVSIAGAYLMADDVPAEHKGKPAQVYLEDGVCRVAAL
jgi:septum site-determining protein MinC